MRLLFLTQSLVHGGAERHAVTLANRLAERGHECHFAYVKNDSSQLSRLRGIASANCIGARKYLDLEALKRLGALVRSVQPTHVIAANEYALFYGWLATRRSSAKLVVTFHSTVPHTLKRRMQMLYYRPLFWSADWLVFVCEAQARYWRRRQLSARRTEVIHNGVDTEHFRPDDTQRARLRRVLGFADDDVVIGLSAVLRPEKNPLALLDACALARRRGVAARALFIGDGPMRAAIEAHAARLGFARELLVTGFQQDVRPLVLACDAMALCSTTETFSLAALEALALGRPVLHAALGGAAEMIEPGTNGFLFPNGDIEAFAERIAALADAPARAAMGARARQDVEARFSERAMIERYENGLQELLIARSKRGNLRRPASAH